MVIYKKQIYRFEPYPYLWHLQTRNIIEDAIKIRPKHVVKRLFFMPNFIMKGGDAYDCMGGTQ